MSCSFECCDVVEVPGLLLQVDASAQRKLRRLGWYMVRTSGFREKACVQSRCDKACVQSRCDKACAQVLELMRNSVLQQSSSHTPDARTMCVTGASWVRLGASWVRHGCVMSMK